MAKRRDNSFEFQRKLIIQLREARRRQGIPSHAVDDMIGCATGLVAKWEVGIRCPTLFNAFCWAQALGCTFQLVEDKDDNLRHRPRKNRSPSIYEKRPGATHVGHADANIPRSGAANVKDKKDGEDGKDGEEGKEGEEGPAPPPTEFAATPTAAAPPPPPALS